MLLTTVSSKGNTITYHRNLTLYLTFLDKSGVEFKDILYHTDVRWLNGKVLKRFFHLRVEIAQFMTSISSISVCRVRTHIIHEMLRDLTAFCIKLKLLRSHLQKCNYVRFSMVSLLHETFTSPFPRQWALETIDSLIDQFNSRFIEFIAHREEIRLFSNPFDADMDTVPEDMQLEIIDLQADDILRCVLREQGIVKFYKQLPAQKYEYLRRFARRMITAFGSTYICEQTFSRMKHIKSKTRSKLTDDHLHGQFRLCILPVLTYI